MTSVHAGLKALGTKVDGVMIALGDQPLLSAADIDALIEAFAARGDKSILVPTHAGKRGNPIVLAHAHRGDILSGRRNLGCKHLVDRNPELVCAVEMDSDHFVRDMDTEAEYRAVVADAARA